VLLAITRQSLVAPSAKSVKQDTFASATPIDNSPPLSQLKTVNTVQKDTIVLQARMFLLLAPQVLSMQNLELQLFPTAFCVMLEAIMI
jgi:hypothetical protein